MTKRLEQRIADCKKEIFPKHFCDLIPYMSGYSCKYLQGSEKVPIMKEGVIGYRIMYKCSKTGPTPRYKAY
jgi:hypothetical protein